MNYYPRAIVRLTVPVMGSIESRVTQAKSRRTITFDVVPKSVRVERTDFNSADACSISFNIDQGVEPRLLSNALIGVCIGDMRTNVGSYAWRDSDVRFLGIATSCQRRMDEGSSTVELRALDFTTLFLKQRPLIPKYIPDYSQTLTQAWARVCDGVGLYDYDRGEVVSSVAILRERIEIRGLSTDPVLGDAVLARVRKMGKLQVQPGADAWSVWKACCDSLGLYTWIAGDRCIVSTAADYYSGPDPIRFRWGLNLKSLEEGRDLSGLNGKGIHLTSFDPLSGTTLESFFPPRESGIVVKKRLQASTKRLGLDSLAPVQDYESHVYPHANVVTQDVLDLAAERIYEERSRQELEGTLQTDEMRALAASGAEADVLALAAGDAILVEIAKDVLDPMRLLQTTTARANYLIERGYDRELAQLIAEDAGFLSRLLPVFTVQKTVIDFDGDRVETSLSFASRINPNIGSTDG